jgi:hypothetical protein
MSAVYRLMPRPPARVESRKMNFSLPSALKSSICDSRSSPDVLPAHSHERNLKHLADEHPGVPDGPAA